jgi:hypothetical protein
MISRVCASTLGVSLVLLADGTAGILDQIDIWRAAGELGIAIVFAVLSFTGMGWWIRRRADEQRQDALRMAARISALESFQQNELLEMTKESTVATTAAVTATKDNTVQLIRMTDALTTLCSRVNARPCAAIEALSDDDRARVMAILRGHYSTTFEPRLTQD